MRSTTFKSSLGPVTALLLVLSAIALVFISRFILLHALIGIGIGILAAPAIERLSDRYSIPKALSGMLLFVVLLALFGGIITLFLGVLAEQCTIFISKYPEIAKKMSSEVTELSRSFPIVKGLAEKFNYTRYFSFTMEGVLVYAQSGFFAITNLAFSPPDNK